jgi:hypothetical protein
MGIYCFCHWCDEDGGAEEGRWRCDLSVDRLRCRFINNSFCRWNGFSVSWLGRKSIGYF